MRKPTEQESAEAGRAAARRVIAALHWAFTLRPLFFAARLAFA